MDLNQAIERLKVKDEVAFEYIYSVTSKLVYTVIIGIIKDHSATEDLMQDTYIKMIQSINSYNNKHKFNTWLTTIVEIQQLTITVKEKKFNP